MNCIRWLSNNTHRRLVQQIYIGGLSTDKTNTFVSKSSFSFLANYMTCRHSSRIAHNLLQCISVFHCMSTLVGSNPCRRIQLPVIAHPIVGINISGTEGAPRDGTHLRHSRRRNGKIWP